MHAVLLAGGWAHPGNDLITMASQILGARGIGLNVVTDPALAANALEAPCDLLVVGSCWFSMTDERYTASQRAQHAVVLDAKLGLRLAELRAQGCPLLAFHTAVISFDADPVWAEWLGGAWNWQTSWHPEPAPIDVRPVAGAPIGCESFSVVDELYQGIDLMDSIDLIAESANGDPLVWLHRAGSGRCAVDLLGHDARSLDEPAHRTLIGQLLDELLRPNAS